MSETVPSVSPRKEFMANETTPKEIEQEHLEAAIAAREQHNQSRLDRLNEIADNNDRAAGGEMTESADGNLELTDTPEGREAAAAREEADAERFLTEQKAKALQEEGAAPEDDGEPQREQTEPNQK
jgi:hypothetical protein